jgi:hypothetical protein
MTTGYEAHQYGQLAGRETPSYYIYDEHMRIHDPVWGDCTIGNQEGDDVILKLLDNDLVRRSMAIEQLTLDATTATIPNTADFSRWEHMWGSLVFVRKMTESLDVLPRDRLILQLRTFVSDLGHTAYSHLGDWMFQGSGGAEDQHDMDLADLLEVSGLSAMLRNNNIMPEEVIFPDVHDWVECSAPNLCVDRVDYAAREILRWLDVDTRIWRTMKPDSFVVRDGQLVMTSQARATLFAKAFLLLPTEHWSEPVHRLQLRIHEELVKEVLQHEYASLVALDDFDKNVYHPRDLMYTVDSDITNEVYVSSEFSGVARPLMQEIGLTKRRIFAHERLGQLAVFLREPTDEFPDPLMPYGYFAGRRGSIPLLPSNIAILTMDQAGRNPDLGVDPYAVDIALPALKPRSVDPLFIDEDDRVRRLSEVDPEYRRLLEQQADLLGRNYVGRLHVNHKTKSVLEAGIASHDAQWAAMLERPRMPVEVFRRFIHNSVGVAAGYRMIDMHWHR